jgi:hypothetical protein
MNLITQNLTLCLENNLLNSIINQLNKDFIQSNVELNIPLNDNPEQIAAQLTEKVKTILVSNEINIQSLLYRIDVNEQKIKALRQFGAEDVAYLIVERIIEKVKMRECYKS